MTDEASPAREPGAEPPETPAAPEIPEDPGAVEAPADAESPAPSDTSTPGTEDVPAPFWARLVLAATPFVAALLVYLVVRALTG